MSRGISDDDYDLAKKIVALGPPVAIPFLYFILSFAYIDGKVDDGVVDKLDDIWGLDIMDNFVICPDDVDVYGSCDVSTPENPLSGLEAVEINVAGTAYEGRSDRIESVMVGDRLKLVHESDNEFDQNAIDVRNKEGSLGHLPDIIAQDVAPLLDSGVSCDAIVTKVVPLSARSARAKKAILKIRLEYNGTSKADSVSKTEQEKLTEEDKERRRKEIERREKEKEAKRKEKEEQKARREEERRQYEMDFEQWEKACEVIKVKRSDCIDVRLAEKKAALESKAKARRDSAVSKAEADLKEQEDIIANAESVLSSLGFFKFGDKRKQKEIIKQARIRIADDKNEITSAENEYSSSMSSLESDVRKKERSIRSSVEKEFPLPAEPKRPSFIRKSKTKRKPVMTADENYKKAILKTIGPGERYTVIELRNFVPEIADLTGQKVSALLNQMVNSGLLRKTEERGKLYYSLV